MLQHIHARNSISSAMQAGRVVKVDSTTGLDGIDVDNRYKKTFSNIYEAEQSAQPGDLVLVYPGEYVEKGLMKDGVRVWCYPGVLIRDDHNDIVGEDAIFSNWADGTGGFKGLVKYEFLGYADFEISTNHFMQCVASADDDVQPLFAGEYRPLQDFVNVVTLEFNNITSTKFSSHTAAMHTKLSLKFNRLFSLGDHARNFNITTFSLAYITYNEAHSGGNLIMTRNGAVVFVNSGLSTQHTWHHNHWLMQSRSASTYNEKVYRSRLIINTGRFLSFVNFGGIGYSLLWAADACYLTAAQPVQVVNMRDDVGSLPIQVLDAARIYFHGTAVQFGPNPTAFVFRNVNSRLIISGTIINLYDSGDGIENNAAPVRINFTNNDDDLPNIDILPGSVLIAHPDNNTFAIMCGDGDEGADARIRFFTDIVSNKKLQTNVKNLISGTRLIHDENADLKEYEEFIGTNKSPIYNEPTE